jgi:N-acetylmuramoyl-L-alanine amidase
VRVLAKEVEVAGRGQVPKPPIEDIIAQLPAHATQRYPQRDRNEISVVILHHSAVPPSVGADRIARYQVDEQKWPGIGFHFFVLADGRLQQTQPLEVVSNQAGDVGNRTGVGVCLAGNFTDQPPPEAQLSATANLVAWLLDELDLALEAIHGHSDYVNTQCPGNTWSPVWRAQLVAQVKDVLAGAAPAVTAPAKSLGHYLLFWQTATDWAEDDWHNAEQYVARFRVTMGFSVDDAMQAEYVTIVGGPSGVPPDAEARLKAAGCKVERVAGETAAATKALLDDMAARGQRFLTLS